GCWSGRWAMTCECARPGDREQATGNRWWGHLSPVTCSLSPGLLRKHVRRVLRDLIDHRAVRGHASRPADHLHRHPGVVERAEAEGVERELAELVRGQRDRRRRADL